MKFEIDFNREDDDAFILSLGAKWEDFGGFSRMMIELDSFEDLQELLNEVDGEKLYIYSAVIFFDPPTIFLDKDV